METLFVAQHRNHHQYYGRNHGHDPARFDSFGSSSSGNFAGISCRTFQSGAGLLPTPLKSFSTSLTKNACSASLSPHTPTPSFHESKKGLKGNGRSSPISIPTKINFETEYHFSERWAGPAYSNSPPPSSLPLPKFSLRPKRTVSLDLPTFASEIDMHPIAKSAPASPTRARSPSPSDLFSPSLPSNLFAPSSPSHLCEHSSSSNLFDRADATKTLRRILNLDITTE